MQILATAATPGSALLRLTLAGELLGYALPPFALPPGAYPLGLGYCPPAECYTAFLLAVPGVPADTPLWCEPGNQEGAPGQLGAVWLGAQPSADGTQPAGARVMFNTLLWLLNRARRTEPLELIVTD